MTTHVSFSLTEQDRDALADFFVNTTDRGPRFLLDYYLRYQFFLLLVAVVFGAWRGIIETLLIYGISNLICYVVHGGRKGLNRKFGQKLSEEILQDGVARQKREVELIPEGIVIEDAWGKQTIRWNATDQLKVMEGGMVFTIRGIPVLFVPRRSFESKESWRAFCESATKYRAGVLDH